MKGKTSTFSALLKPSWICCCKERYVLGTAEGPTPCNATCTQPQLVWHAHSSTSASTEFTCYSGFSVKLNWDHLIYMTDFHRDSLSDTYTPLEAKSSYWFLLAGQAQTRVAVQMAGECRGSSSRLLHYQLSS